MKTKVLIVPTLIIVSGFVSLHYIKPDFDLYMEKRIQRDAAKESSLAAEAVATNVRALKEELTTKKEQVAFVKRYLPAEKDEARMFDSLNFLTTQSGLLASSIQVKEVKNDEATDQPAQVFATEEALADGTAADPTDITMAPVPLYKAPKVEEYGIALEAIGGYGNIKDLLKRLTEFDRIQDIESFNIAVEEVPAAEGGEPVSASTLVFSYSSVLPYQATPGPISGQVLVAVPGLSQPNFNFAAIDEVKAKAVVVPDMVLGTEGKANPFE